jgi:hypothetical protein
VLITSCPKSPQTTRLGQILTGLRPTTFAFARWQSVILQGDILDFHPPKISSADYMLLLLKLCFTVGLIFLSVKIDYELNQIESIPSFLGTFQLVTVCVVLAWFYRINYKFKFLEHRISSAVSYNMLGFTFITATINSNVTRKLRIWNPSQCKLQLSENYLLEFIFKSSDSSHETGCRVVVLNNAIKLPN